ncbi:TetR/AcrR family transcriptional regulator [Rhodococcus sp. DMU1]|uniref:TetR/AcrR family transcriptional regulator n=1 Tax=Rhodococcus sp. DMU1 TaxID=2722825 RepID=UPI001FF0C124|nr:TetR/AcrR family transcriptional regulator [Rhodococcus sp. DMU1]
MAKGAVRADAARNKEKILAVARQCFAEQGLEVSLDSVAKRAGVGAGTLYRHFPGREALVAELLDAEMGALEQNFVSLRDSDLRVEEKLERWSHELRRWMTSYAGLPEPLREALDGGSGALTVGCDVVIGWTEEIVQEAKAAGVVKDFVTGREFYRATLGLAWVATAAGVRGGAEADGLHRMAREGWASPGRGTAPV